MPGFGMDELKGPEMISETLGRASVWIPDKAPVGNERFNCPATAIDKLEPGGELSNCWEEPPPEMFMVRGKHYLKVTKAKIEVDTFTLAWAVQHIICPRMCMVQEKHYLNKANVPVTTTCD